MRALLLTGFLALLSPGSITQLLYKPVPGALRNRRCRTRPSPRLTSLTVEAVP